MISINPLIGAALISGGSSLLNNFSQAVANAQNLKIARETNAMNYKIFQESNEFNRRMALEQWQRETGYNSPRMQMQRALDAGLNPFSVFGSQSNTTGVSNMSPPTSSGAIPMQSATVQPLNFGDTFAAFSSVASALNSLGEAKKKGIETEWLSKTLEQQWKGLQLDNNWKQFTQEIDSKLYQWNANWQSEQLRANVSKTLNEVSKLVEDISNAQKQGKIYDEELAIKKFDKIVSEANSKWLPKTVKQQFINSVKQGNQIDAETNKIHRETSLLGNTIDGVEMPKDVLDNFRKRVSKEVSNDTQRAEIQSILNQIEQGQLDSGFIRGLESAKIFLGHIPIIGDLIDFVKSYAKSKTGVK